MDFDTKPGHPWNHGICTCDCGACLRSCFCPCVLFGRTSYRLAHRDDVQLKGYHTCNVNCLAWCGLCILGYIPAITFQALRRCTMRQDLLIDGNPVKDGCAAFWCQGCVLVQDDCEARDWQKRKAPYAAAQPVPRGQMRYPPSQPAQQSVEPGVAHYGSAHPPVPAAQYGTTQSAIPRPPAAAAAGPPRYGTEPPAEPPPKY